MENQDYGVAPSLRFGIGTPTEVTLDALLTHNHDMPDYGLPPVNGAPAAVDRKNFYGATDDRTIQDVVNLNATITPQVHARRHAAQPDAVLALQDRRARVRAEQRRHAVAGGVYTAFPGDQPGQHDQPAARSSLYVGLGSHDRVITDTSLYNQTDVITEFATGAVRHQLIAGLELGRGHATTRRTTRATSRAIRTTSSARCRSSTRCTLPAARHRRRSPATSCRRERDRRRAVHQRHDVVRRRLEGRRRRALRPLQREPHQLDQPAAVGEPDASASPACAPA